MDKAQLNQFTLEEKARIVVGASFFGTVDMPQKGIKRALFLDGGTGLNFEQLFGDFCTQDPEMRKYFGTHTLQNVIEYYYTPETNLYANNIKSISFRGKKIYERAV